MKILLVSNLFGKYSRGGAERVVEREAVALADLGHDVTVCSGVPLSAIPKGVCSPVYPVECPPPPGMDASLFRAPAVAGVRRIHFYPPNIYFYANDSRQPYAKRLLWHVIDTFNVASARKFALILRKEKPDVVHTHNLMGLGFLIPGVLRRSKIRHVHTVHDVQLIHPSGRLPATGGGSPLRAVADFASSTVMEQLWFGMKNVVFPTTFIEQMHLRHRLFREAERTILKNPAPAVAGAPREVQKRLHLLFVGQLAAAKGILFLLDALEAATVELGHWTLEIAGDGEASVEVRRRAADLPNVHFLGRLGEDDLREAYRRAAFTVVPSLIIENQPTVIGESFAAGTPVIAAASGGIVELVDEGKNGFLFKPGDSEALRDALRRASAALPQWSAMFGRAKRAAQGMGIEAHLAALMKLYGG